MSHNTTDISSDFDITAVETDAFDKNQLISWASKLELESIDYRTSSIDLMEALSKISKTLTDSLNSVNQHLFHLRSKTGKINLQLKDYIQVSISEELDVVYSRIAYLFDKFNELQSFVSEKNDNREKDLEFKVFQLQNEQSTFNKLILGKLEQLENLNLKDKPMKLTMPEITPIKIQNDTKRVSLEINPKPLKSATRIHQKRKFNTKITPKSISKSTFKKKQEGTLTRKLIFD